MQGPRLCRAPLRRAWAGLEGERAHPPASRAYSLIREIREGVISGQTPAVQVTRQYLDAIAARDSELHAFLALDSEGALRQAEAVDAAARAGAALGPLAGVPFAVKDNLCTQGLATTAGSRLLQGHIPAYDASAVARLRAAGAVLLGKTNQDEFGMGSSTEASGYGPTRNPHDHQRVPGGSSGGSAAAVAAGMVPFALGSDTGGSVRQPAAYCGTVGLKPTYGRVPRHGLIAYASSLDCVGVLAASAQDAADVLSVIAGQDSMDATSSHRPPPAAETFDADSGPAPLAGVTLGVLTSMLEHDSVDPGVVGAVGAGVAALQALGATTRPVALPSFEAGLPAYYVIALSEASSNLARYDGVRYGRRVACDELREMMRQTRHDGLGREVQRRILLGTYALSAGYYDAFYDRAQRVRTLVTQELQAALADCDVVVLPTSPTPAQVLGMENDDPLAMYLGDLMTVAVNLAGVPAVSVPCGMARAHPGDAPLPVGLQLVGRPFDEMGILRIAHALEREAGL